MEITAPCWSKPETTPFLTHTVFFALVLEQVACLVSFRRWKLDSGGWSGSRIGGGGSGRAKEEEEEEEEWKDKLLPRMQNGKPYEGGNVTGVKAHYQKIDFSCPRCKTDSGRGLVGGVEPEAERHRKDRAFPALIMKAGFLLNFLWMSVCLLIVLQFG